jgi:hypothetical protein
MGSEIIEIAAVLNCITTAGAGAFGDSNITRAGRINLKDRGKRRKEEDRILISKPENYRVELGRRIED